MESFQSAYSLTSPPPLKLLIAFFMKSSPLWLPHITGFGFLPSPVFPPQSTQRLLFSAYFFKAGGLSYHLWADTSHIHIYRPVPSPALLSSTSDYFLGTFLGVPHTHIKLTMFITELIISLSSPPARLPVSPAQLPALMTLRTSLRPKVIRDSSYLSWSPHPGNCTS